MSVVSISVDLNAGMSRLAGAPSVELAAALSAGNPGDGPRAVSLSAGGGTGSASRACGDVTGSAGGAAGCGGVSDKKPTPKKTAMVAAPTAPREAKKSRGRKSSLGTVIIVYPAPVVRRHLQMKRWAPALRQRPIGSMDSRQRINDPMSEFMGPDLTDEEKSALATELTGIAENDRFPLSRRIQLLKAILAKLRTEPVREPLAPLRHYAPPKGTLTRRRWAGR